jgi:hypothetical protein
MTTFIGTLLLVSLAATIVPTGLLMKISRRQPLSDNAAQRLLYGLLATIIVLTAAMHGVIYSGGLSGIISVAGAPLMMTSAAITCLHIYRTPTLHNHRTMLTLLIFASVIILLNLSYAQFVYPSSSNDGLFIITALVGAGVITAFIWQTVHRHNRWLWLGLVALIIALGVYDFAYNGVLATWPGWLLWLLDIVATFVTPVVLIVLAGRVAFYLANDPHPIDWRRWIAGGAAAGILIALLIINFVDIFLLDGFDDWGPIMLPLFFGTLALSVAILLVWTLRQRRIPAAVSYLMVMLAASFAFFALLFNSTSNPTISRAGQVDRAIQAYHTDNGEYPTSLYDLTPRYLPVLPNPMLYADHEWCYEGGGNFYRLAYVSSPVWGAPANTFGIERVNSAGEPAAEAWMCDVLLVKYRDRWGVKAR